MDRQKKMRLSGAALTPMQGEGAVPRTETLQDADAGLVAQAQSGGLEAFEELVRRHSFS